MGTSSNLARISGSSLNGAMRLMPMKKPLGQGSNVLKITLGLKVPVSPFFFSRKVERSEYLTKSRFPLAKEWIDIPVSPFFFSNNLQERCSTSLKRILL